MSYTICDEIRAKQLLKIASRSGGILPFPVSNLNINAVFVGKSEESYDKIDDTVGWFKLNNVQRDPNDGSAKLFSSAEEFVNVLTTLQQSLKHLQLHFDIDDGVGTERAQRFVNGLRNVPNWKFDCLKSIKIDPSYSFISELNWWKGSYRNVFLNFVGHLLRSASNLVVFETLEAELEYVENDEGYLKFLPAKAFIRNTPTSLKEMRINSFCNKIQL